MLSFLCATGFQIIFLLVKLVRTDDPLCAPRFLVRSHIFLGHGQNLKGVYQPETDLLKLYGLDRVQTACKRKSRA
jgi:hypothetical protein